MCYWLDMGVDGLCLDVIFYLIECDGISSENLLEIYQVFKCICVELDVYYFDCMLLVEVNQWLEDIWLYFGGEDGGEGDECYMVFYFLLMLCMYMVIVQEDCYLIIDILCQILDILVNC